jgi:hypothetical protein
VNDISNESCVARNHSRQCFGGALYYRYVMAHHRRCPAELVDRPGRPGGAPATGTGPGTSQTPSADCHTWLVLAALLLWLPT